MKVRDVMRSPVISVAADAKYEEAARLLRENHLSGLPVIGPDGTLVGVVSEKDLFRAIYPRYEEFASSPEACLDQEAQESAVHEVRSTPVSQHMTAGVLTVSPNAPVLQAGGLMLARGIHRLPVVESGKLVGIVTRREIYGAILQRELGIESRSFEEARLRKVQNR